MLRSRRLLGSMVLVLVLPVMVTACSAARTSENFCSVMDKHKQRYEAAMAEAASAMNGTDASSLLKGVAKMTSAVGDLQVMWDELANVAPGDIQPDVEVVRDTNKKELDLLKDAADDPLGVLASGLLSGLTSSGSFERVNRYSADHCGSAPFVTTTEQR